MPPLQAQPKVNEQLLSLQGFGSGEVAPMLAERWVRHVPALVLEVQRAVRVAPATPLLEQPL